MQSVVMAFRSRSFLSPFDNSWHHESNDICLLFRKHFSIISIIRSKDILISVVVKNGSQFSFKHFSTCKIPQSREEAKEVFIEAEQEKRLMADIVDS